MSTSVKNASFDREISTIIKGVKIPPENAKDGYVLIIKGKPGTGKTTFALHMLELFNKQNPSQLKINTIYCTNELQKEISFISKQFGLSFFGDEPACAKLTPIEINENFPSIKKTIDQRFGIHPGCIIIDGLSILKIKKELVNEFISGIIELSRNYNLYTIIIADEELINEHFSLEYMCDGIIKLTSDNSQHRYRYLEIIKMRYIDYLRGPHAFELQKLPWLDKSSLRIFPSISAQIVNSRSIYINNNKNITNKKYKSGIIGLDQILSYKHKDGAFSPGDIFLLTCEPGTDKLGFGISFLSQHGQYNDNNEALWISFGPSKIFSSSSSSDFRSNYFYLFKNYINFDKDKSECLKYQYQKEKEKIDLELANKNYNEETIIQQKEYIDNIAKIKLIDLDRPSRLFHPDRVIDCLVDRLTSYDNKSPIRIVIDRLNSIGRDLDDNKKTFEYIVSIASLLKQFNVICLMLFDTNYVFRPMGQVQMDWSINADYIGSLRLFELNNQTNSGFTLTKSKYDDFQSKPFHISYRTDVEFRSMVIEDRGWPTVSMLNGVNRRIEEAKVFFKFFDQASSNMIDHRDLLRQFENRYQDDQKFAFVQKRFPNPKHWSFLGYAGAGHSNTKVLCLKQAVLEMMEKDNKLMPFPRDEWYKYHNKIRNKYPSRSSRNAKIYCLWGLVKPNTHESKKDTEFVQPVFADMSVMCSQVDVDTISKNLLSLQNENISDFDNLIKNLPKKMPKTWNDLFKINKKFQLIKEEEKKSKKILTPPWIENVFALPSFAIDNSSFFAFLLEILFDFYGLNNSDSFDISRKELIEIINSKAFDRTIHLIQRIVNEGLSKNPVSQINYHTAYFSRRWFSEIDQYDPDDSRYVSLDKLVSSEHINAIESLKNGKLSFSISPLPSVHTSNKKIGISSLEVYSAGVIKGALAPETAFMFISELTMPTIMKRRFEKRRGIPMNREDWNFNSANIQRKEDVNCLDNVLDNDRFFTSSRIHNYYSIETKMLDIFRIIFHGCGYPNTNNKVYKPDKIREEFINIINDSTSKT